MPILFCVLCENLRAQEWLTVEDGNTSSPYYTFETIQQVPIDISTYGFQRGQSYAFLPQGVSTNHPFMIGEHNGDLNSSLLSVVGGGTVTPLTYNTSNLMITIPSNYSGNLVYFSTTDTSVHYYLSIVDPPGGNYQSSGGGYQSGGGGYQSPGSSYQPVYDLNASHLTNLSVQVNQSLAGKYSFFNRTNSSGSPEIRLELMEVATGQWQPQGIASSLYYLAKPDLFPSIPHIYDYLTSINLSPVNGYKPPGVNYQSSGSGYSSPPIYETTATLLVNNQPTSITGIPRAATGSTWYQSFTAENSAKLTKFAFATNGSFSATADVTIREGEGVAGNILHSGTWTGLGSNTNSFNEYEITNEVLLTSGQKYTIQLENQTAGGFIGSNPGQYNGGMFYYSGYSGEYGDLKMKIWGQLKATGNAIDIISPATNDQNITDDNHTLTISYNYQSDSGGYQTPTWAYRIDSGFPSYGSPHGGTQVTGSRTKNNFLSGQTYGSKTVYVALLDQNGNLYNPPITLNRTLNYQSSGGGYSSPGSGYSSPGNGYSSPGGGYSSAGSGYSSPPIYETTATLIVNNQPTSITGIPRAATGSTWYQSFTAENSAKLTKFAFATNGSFSATADVTIREGEGVAGNILHSGTWTGLGSNTNSFNEYEITNEVLLTSGQKYTIQLENQTAGGFIGSNPGQYNGGMFYYSGYSGEYGDLKMKIWGQLKATGNAIDIISPATNDQNITDDNHTLTISYNYQSDSGGYQTPTWAYRIDSGFPSYGSPHGGTQVTGSRTKNNFLSGQTYGSKTVYVALLDQNGNLYNPPITLNRTLNYQSSGGGYSSPGGGYSSPDSGYSTPANGYSSPGDGYSSPNSGYTSPSDGYNSPDSGYSTPANGYNSPGDGYSSPNSGYTSPSDGYNSPDSGYSTPANGYSSPGEGYSSPNSGYTSPSGGYNSPDSGYSTPANGYSSPGDGYSSPNSGYTSPSDGYNSPDSGYSTPANGYNSPGDGYSSPNSGYTSPSDGYNSPDSGYSTPANGYSSPGEGYSSPDSGYSSPSDGYESIPALLAFVNTVGHESDQDGIILSGEILRESDTNNDNIMVGFLLSTNIDLLLNDPFTQKVIGEFKNEGLFTGNFNSTLDGVIYYKAFAENEMGVSYGKVNKIAVIKSTNSQGQSPTEKAISTLGEDSIELPGGWNDNSWFGLYKVYENGWIYHSAHGWLYLSADSSDGIWAWSEKRSWVWSSKEIYPFLYQPSIGNWIYFLTSKNGQVYFFNYSTNLVEVNIP
ncbi:hypothetical protein [Candidatus Seribacter sulfatis]|uniref:hypothetical protein n=1 Tax=Candidatus Seribacter sulfatis TaxID=3381756 RepID=UPI00389A1ED3